MKVCFNSMIIVLALVVFSHVIRANTSNANTILQIAQGDRLLVKKDVVIPANTERLNFGVKTDVGFKYAGCALAVIPSQKSRKIPLGAEIVFSGVSQKTQVKNVFKDLNFTFVAGVMNSEAVVAVECYGTSFESQYKDLYVSGMVELLKEFFDFSPVEPEITH